MQTNKTLSPGFLKEERAELVSGFLAAAEFADCGPDADEEVQEADWTPEARAQARQWVDAWLASISVRDLQDSVRGQGEDVFFRFGSDIYYGMAGHGVGFWDRKELAGGLGDRLHQAAQAIRRDIFISSDGKGGRVFG